MNNFPKSSLFLASFQKEPKAFVDERKLNDNWRARDKHEDIVNTQSKAKEAFSCKGKLFNDTNLATGTCGTFHIRENSPDNEKRRT